MNEQRAKILRSALSNLGVQIFNWKRAINLIWSASPRYTLAWAILLLVQGVLPGLLVYLTKHVIDALVVALGSSGDWMAWQPALVLVGAIASVMLLTDVFQSTKRTQA